MVRHLIPISALLLGSAFLLYAGGMNGLILPVRGSQEGFSAFSLGLLGTGWAIGYVLGCIMTPGLVGRVGHIRSFSVMASLAALAILASLLFITPWAWIPLRAISGFCFAGAAMIVESWLSERVDASSRGRVFGVYTMVNLMATTTGQLTLTLGETGGYTFFVIGAMFYSLALIPTAISSTATPKPLVKVRLDLGALWRNSPVAVYAVLMVGISNSAFGTLAAVYADQIGLRLSAIALFTSIPILAGALAQLPVGQLSDRMDRRKVLIGITIVGVIGDLAFIILQPELAWVNFILVFLFGAAAYAMYPVIVAHAHDHAEPDSYIQTSGGLLLVFGVGCIVGPLFAGFGMSAIGTSALFMTTIAVHILIVIYTIWRISRRAPVKPEHKVEFVPSAPTRTTTPETVSLALSDDQEEDAGSDA
ncbi:MFS transporter [Hoeflea sp. WL0058]|uniref:MFS transporter n=1 Tax=Flavimaribacter sediminis TaxID=2865987 RepID=A0AAE2ZN32_9HYPH|nr:MFS transporter [Flavimaribacter sediminis]MBW8639678.1 MFS transporter [Flavimaribacter sediminis]